jgi:hypothetical protein
MSAVVLEKKTEKLADLRIYAHSDLLYWWPVWVMALVMAMVSYFDGYLMVLAPENSTIEATQVTAPEGGSLSSPLVHVARSRLPGVIFVITVLLIMICAHTWIRGPWALFFAATTVAALLLISWLDWWVTLFGWMKLLRVYINLGGYLLIGVPLMIAWVLTFFLFDRRTYIVFSVGQVRFRDLLGQEEKAFDTSQVYFEKRPFDWFRRLVGFGAGDMMIRAGGAQPYVMELRNVVRVGSRLYQMEERLRTKDVE